MSNFNYAGANIVLKNQGQTIPDAFWDKAIPSYGNVLGLAVVQDKELKTIHLDDKEMITKEMLNEVQESYKDNCVIFFMGDFTEGYQVDSIQPFTVLTNSKDEPILSVFLTGAFSQFAKAESSHSPAFFCANEYIAPTLKNIFNKDCGNKIDNLMQKLREDHLVRTAITLSLQGGVMCFLANTGEVVTFGDVEKLSFGWVIDACEYSEDPVEEEEPVAEEPPKKLSIMDKLKGAVQKPATPPTPVPSKKEEEVVQKHTDDTAIDDAKEYEETVVKLPDTKRSKNEKKDFWRAELGFLPPDYLKIREFRVRRNKATGELIGENNQPIVKGRTYKTFLDMATAVAQSKSNGKDTSTHHIPAPDTAVKPPAEAPSIVPEAKQELSDQISVLTEMDRKAIAKQFLDGASVKRSLDQHSQQIMNPEKMQTELAKIKPLTEELSIKLVDTFKWDREALLALGKVSVEGLVQLCHEYRMKLPEYKAYITEARKPQENKQETASKPKRSATF